MEKADARLGEACNMAFPAWSGQCSNRARSRNVRWGSPISDMGIWHVWRFQPVSLPAVFGRPCMDVSTELGLVKKWGRSPVFTIWYYFIPPSFSLISHSICNLPSIPQILHKKVITSHRISAHRSPHKVKSNEKQQSWRPTRVIATAAKQNGPSNLTKEVISFGISFIHFPIPRPLFFNSYPTIHPSIPNTKIFHLHSVKHITHWHFPFPPLATAPPASFSVAANPPSTR